jgi:hypothetical protein
MLMNSRLAAQLQRNVKTLEYSDFGYLLIDVPDGTYDDYNNPVVTVSEIPLACAFTAKANVESWKSYVDVEQLEAEVRFERAHPTKGNRFKLVSRFGNNIDPCQEYEIFGIRNRDVFGYACALKAVVI